MGCGVEGGECWRSDGDIAGVGGAGAVAGRGGAVVGGDRSSKTKPMNPSQIFRHYLIGAGDDETQVQVVPVAAPPSRKPKTIAGDAAAMAVAKRSPKTKAKTAARNRSAGAFSLNTSTAWRKSIYH